MSNEDEAVIKVGSRKSPLALAQTNYVVEQLKKFHAEKKFEIVTITTTGDHILDTALSKIGEKALFTKELEVALTDKEVDFVVHSLKDLPTSLPDGLVVGAICKRVNPHDVVVLKTHHKGKTLASLDPGSTIGTSSLRRVAQLKRRYEHLKFIDIRGNLNTRFKKLEEGTQYDGIVLAAAGLIRMGWEDKISQVLSPEDCMHAVGQGALAIECRSNDKAILSLIETLSHNYTTLCCVSERAFMKALEGGCSVPVAVSTYYKDGKIHMKGGVYSLDGSEALTESVTKTCKADADEDDPPSKKMRCDESNGCYSEVGVASIVHLSSRLLRDAAQVGEDLAELLLAAGAKPILNALKES